MFSMLQYDIPNASGFSNPSRRLRRLAIRTSLSVWIIRDDHVPHHLISEMAAAGCTVRLLPFASQATQQVLGICVEELQKEVVRVTESLAKSLARTGDKLEAGKVSRHRCEAAMRASLARADKALDDARRVALLFNITAHVGIGTAAIEALHAEALRKARAYADLASEVEETSPDLAEAARNDDVPAGVLADRIEDETGRDMSETYRTFGPAITPEPDVVPESEEVVYARSLARLHNVNRNPFAPGSDPYLAYEETFLALAEAEWGEMIPAASYPRNTTGAAHPGF